MMSKEIALLIQRFNPAKDSKPRLQEYKIPYKPGMTVLDAILYARDYLDHSIGVRFSCRMASCGSCGMKINGKPRLACYTQVSELRVSRIIVQPMDNFPIIKDLVTDLDVFFAKHKMIKPFIIRQDIEEMERPTADYLMKPEELESIIQFTYCIKCGLCYSACPTVATDELFPGPQALVQAYRYLADARDEGGEERIKIVDNEHGVWRCHFAGSCSSVCPKGVDPALGIQLLKRYVISAKPPRRRGEGAKLSRANKES